MRGFRHLQLFRVALVGDGVATQWSRGLTRRICVFPGTIATSEKSKLEEYMRGEVSISTHLSGKSVQKGKRPVRSPLLFVAVAVVSASLLAGMIDRLRASTDEDGKTVAALDKKYQAAVKRNDADTMAGILADDFVLVTGSGKTYTKVDMLEDARRGDIYDHNDEETQTVRIWGDTAVVTAKLWEKYTSKGKTYDHKFWFSDTYVRTPAGWKYVFGQSSSPPCRDPKP
jgi:hypothetical protein